MNFDLTEEQQMVKETARKFAATEIMPFAKENDVKEHFPVEIFNKMAALGFLGGPIPEKYGGAGLDFISDAIIFEEIGRADSSLRTALSVQVSIVGLTILNWGSEAQRQKYLPKLCRGEFIGCFALTEPGAGSDAANLSTSAVLKGAEWILNGTKTWISSGSIADISIVFAVTDKTKGHHGITAFIVEKNSPGFSTKDIKGKLGLRASNTAELIFQDCRISKDAVLGSVGDGFKVAMSALDNGRYGVAAGCVGIIQGCIDVCAKYAKERHQFGKPIAGFQLIQDKIARMVVDCDAARLLVYRAGHLKNKGVTNTVETSIAKYFASEAANRAASEAVQIFGAYGYSNEYPVERYFRDAKVATIYEGTSEIQKLIIAGHVLGVKAFS
ncbi:MAG: acyl-CoA dehydrogenase family protein [Deltaproteobacteria bacterium]|nr:acyl-CoA dehydrogenase family protein [Deltaproteobacteria bacterium]